MTYEEVKEPFKPSAQRDDLRSSDVPITLLIHETGVLEGSREDLYVTLEDGLFPQEKRFSSMECHIMVKSLQKANLVVGAH